MLITSRRIELEGSATSRIIQNQNAVVSKTQISIICDHGGPHRTTHTTIHTPETSPFHLATIFMGKNPTPEPKILIFSIFLSQPTPSVSKTQISIICDHGGPHRTPQTTIHTPETSPFHFPFVSILLDSASVPPTTGKHIFFVICASLSESRKTQLCSISFLSH